MWNFDGGLSIQPLYRRKVCVSMSVLWLLACVVTDRAMADDWPQWRGKDRNGVWSETGVVEAFETEQLPLVWSVDIGPGYSGPTVANGRVYITDRITEPKQIERVHCFDAKTGNQIWSHEYDCVYRGVGYEAGPRANVTVDGGHAYALGSMGHLHTFDAATGDVIWKSALNERYGIKDDRMPIWGIAAAPLVYEDTLILQIGGEKGACVVALDRKTGEERWRALDDRASYSAPILITQANQTVLVVWTGDRILGMNPKTGDVHWDSPMPPKNMVINIATPVYDPETGYLFLTAFYDGSKMMKLAKDELKAEELWRIRGDSERNTAALHSIMATPILEGEYIYGVDSYGELRCLDAKTGDRIWEDLTATSNVRWGNIHMVRHQDKVWMFNERGELLITKLSPKGFEELSRTRLLEPTTVQLKRRGEGVCWSHPAFANRHVFVRNDKRLVCASLAKP